MDSSKKRRKDPRWFNQKKFKRGFTLCPDLRGFLLFCNGKEREAIREGYILLNESADEDQRPVQDAAPKGSPPRNCNDRGEPAIVEDELELEKAELRKAAERPEAERRFQVVESSVENSLFIRTTVRDPVALATNILEKVRDGGTPRSRHLIRLVPVEKTCKAYPENVRAALVPLLRARFPGLPADDGAGEGGGENLPAAPPTYCVLFRSRLNNNFGKDDAVKVASEALREISPGSKVNYKSPDVCVVFEVLKSICCLSVLPNFFALKKYNLVEIVANKGVEVDDPKCSGEPPVPSSEGVKEDGQTTTGGNDIQHHPSAEPSDLSKTNNEEVPKTNQD